MTLSPLRTSLRNLPVNPNADISRIYRKSSNSPCKQNELFGPSGIENAEIPVESNEDWDHKLHQIRIFNFELERQNREKSTELQNQRRRLDDAYAEAAQSALEAREASIMAESMSRFTSPGLLRQVNKLIVQLKTKSERIRGLERTISEQASEIIRLKNEVSELKGPHAQDGNPQDNVDTMCMTFELGDFMLAQEQTVVIF
jgi:hypothetical protein